MFGSLCKKLCWNPNLKVCFVGYSNIHLDNAQYSHYLSLLINIKSFSSSQLPKRNLKSHGEDKHRPFIVSYLINSCHLSLEDAISASGKVHFKTPQKPDSILTLLKTHGFTDAHISKAVIKLPKLLLADPKNTILPKLEFFKSIGIPSFELVVILSRDPSLLQRSLKNSIIPSYSLLKNFLGTDEKVLVALKRCSLLLRQDFRKKLISNVAILKETGVPQSSISLLVIQFPKLASVAHERFKESVECLKGIAFDLEKSTYVEALKVISIIGTEGLEQKFKIYRRWGWSKDEATLAFKYKPNCMVMCKKQIIRKMDYLVTKMGWPSKHFARRPVFLCYSLDKRIIPRCSVFNALIFKGMIKDSLSLCNFLKLKEECFLQRFVTRYQEDFPQLMDLYEGKIDLVKLGIGPEEKCQMKHI